MLTQVLVNSTSFSIQALTLNYRGAASRATPREIKWIRPDSGTYKLNVDACFFPNGLGASGAVLRNSKGDALAGAGCSLDHLLDAATAEAVALRKGLLLIENLGCRPVIVETDSLELVEAMKL